jgi:hypothetical protein
MAAKQIHFRVSRHRSALRDRNPRRYEPREKAHGAHDGSTGGPVVNTKWTRMRVEVANA